MWRCRQIWLKMSLGDNKKTFLFRKWREVHQIYIEKLRNEVKELEDSLISVHPFQQNIMQGCVSYLKNTLTQKEYVAGRIHRNPTSQESVDEIANFFYCQIRGSWDNLARVENENKQLKRELMLIKSLPTLTHLDQNIITIILAYCL